MTTTTTTRRFFLRNQWGWSYCYVVTGKEPWCDVRITRRYRGECAGPDLVMNVVEARDHYKNLQRRGFNDGKNF